MGKVIISFYDWCYENLSKDEADIIMSRWDYKKNVDRNGKIILPKEVGFCSRGLNNKGYWFKCFDHSEHESEQKRIKDFINGKTNISCIQCNSISITHPHLVKFLVNKEDAFKFSYGSHKKLLMKCPDCGREKEVAPNDLKRQGFSCICSDGKSYPEKFCFNFLEIIKKLDKINDFETEKTFDWLKYSFKNKIRKGFLDFYFELNDQRYVIEMDGYFHTKDNSMNGQTKEESKFIDDEKDRLCKEHDIIVIRIDSLKSEWEYIKNNIINSNPNLPKLLNFKEDDIDWLKCHEYACNSLVKVVCDMWNGGINKIKDIIEISKIKKSTVTKYLKQGADLGWCGYNPNEEIKKRLKLMQNNRIRKIICLTTDEVFSSAKEAKEKYNIAVTGIRQCCKQKRKSAGKLPDGTKLVWKYYDDYLKELS